MSGYGSGKQVLTPELLLRAYSAGIFPMAESRDDPGIFWVDPQVRGVMPLETFHVPRRLKKRSVAASSKFVATPLSPRF